MHFVWISEECIASIFSVTELVQVGGEVTGCKNRRIVCHHITSAATWTNSDMLKMEAVCSCKTVKQSSLHGVKTQKMTVIYVFLYDICNMVLSISSYPGLVTIWLATYTSTISFSQKKKNVAVHIHIMNQHGAPSTWWSGSLQSDAEHTFLCVLAWSLNVGTQLEIVIPITTVLDVSTCKFKLHKMEILFSL